MYAKKIFLIVTVFIAVAFTACKKWGDDTKPGSQDLTLYLSQAIASNTSLSKFSQYLQSTGLDSLLRSSKTYTVWAPDDAAMAALDPGIASDPVKLRAFLLNHISNQSYFTKDAQTTLRVPVLSGKYNNFLGNKFDEATITSADRFVKNGVLHVINKIVPVLPSLWDFINSSQAQYMQNAFIAGLNFDAFDPATAVIDSISSTTGLPIYHPGTGIIVKNRFNDRVYDFKDESREYTYFVIVDAGFTLEADSLKPYYASGSATSTDSLAKWNTVKDLAAEGAYPVTALQGLLSNSGTPIPIDPAQIIETMKLSNGVAYILNKVDVVNNNKFKTIMVQGEFPSGFLIDRSGNTNYRVRYNPFTNQDYTDIMVTGHGVTTFYSFYRLRDMPTMTYHVYGSAVNDFQTSAFTQNIIPKFLVAPGTYTTLATLPYAVPLYSAAGAYGEKDLGSFTISDYGTVDIQLTCLTTGPIVLDYLRLVPQP